MNKKSTNSTQEKLSEMTISATIGIGIKTYAKMDEIEKIDQSDTWKPLSTGKMMKIV